MTRPPVLTAAERYKSRSIRDYVVKWGWATGGPRDRAWLVKLITLALAKSERPTRARRRRG